MRSRIEAMPNGGLELVEGDYYTRNSSVQRHWDQRHRDNNTPGLENYDARFCVVVDRVRELTR